MENKIKQKAQEMREKYKNFKDAQQNFYSAYKAEFGDTRELELLIYKGIQASYRQEEYFDSLMDLISSPNLRTSKAQSSTDF